MITTDSGIDTAVRQILDEGPGRDERNLKTLIKVVSGHTGKVETVSCDLKSGFEDTNQAWVNISKDIVAMSNSGGGVIVIGVEDSGRRKGLDNSILSLMDPARINGQIEPKAPGARVNASYYETTYYRLRYGFLCIRAQDDLIVFEKEWGYNKPDGKQKIVIRKGVLYTRGVGESRPASQGDLTQIVNRLIQTGSQALLARVEKIATLPLSLELAAFDPGAEGQGVRLVDSGHGQPVRVVSEGEDAIPISEVLNADLPFSSKQAELVSQVRTWRAGHPEHRVQPLTLNSWYLARSDLKVNDDMAEFAFLSAGYESGYAVFWASLMSTERLDAVLERELDLMKYPMRQVLPFVVGALRYDQRKALLDNRLKAFKGAGGSAEKVLNSRSFDKFKRSGRMGADSFRLLGDMHKMSVLQEDREAATKLFESALIAELEGKNIQRSSMHQLDIFLHASQS